MVKVEHYSKQYIKDRLEQWFGQMKFNQQRVVWEERTDGYRLRLYGSQYEYVIVAFTSDYLGAVSTRHGTGNDLADGPFTLSTWYKILSDIVGCELIKQEDWSNENS